MMMRRSALLVVVLAWGAGCAAARADEASLAAALETGQTVPTGKLKMLYENPSPVQSEANNEEKASWVRSLRGAVVGRDRLLFEVEFDHPPVMERSSFCLYLDMDGNEATGRDKVGVEGVDLMAMVNPRDATEPQLGFYSPNLSDDNSALRIGWEDNRLYLTIQTPLEKLDKPVRVFFLSQKDGGVSNFQTPDDVSMILKPENVNLPPLR